MIDSQQTPLSAKLKYSWTRSMRVQWIPSGLKTLLERRDAQDMSLVHKFLTERSGSDMFRQIAANGRAGTRQAAGGHGLSVQYARTDPRKYSFAVRTVEKWNRLPDEVKSAPTGKAFKEKLKKLYKVMLTQ